MSYFSVDIEADHTSPATGSMVCFGAVLVSDISKTFYGKTKPLKDTYNPEALAISGFTRDEHLSFNDPESVMENFNDWVLSTNKHGRPQFISDNPAFDWQWINYYFDMYGIKNPFGYSARRIGDLYCGLKKDTFKNREWKQFRKTKHDHNPVNDAIGNAEALLEIKKQGLKIKF